ncbi:MAG TPA: DUF5372 family protein [Chloroflexota bacterium]|nr:DUF5372 family protein [Chloroflexota bacterium]
MSHPHHPLCGQRVEVVRVRRGADPDLIVRLPDGRHAAIAQSWTAEPHRPAAERPAAAAPLLAADGLRELAALVAHLRARRCAKTEIAANTPGSVP